MFTKEKITVLDSSVIINLLATDHLKSLISLLENPLLVEDHVYQEITKHPCKNIQLGNTFKDMFTENLIKRAFLSEYPDRAYEHFINLMAGDSSISLHDGEAGTIALAVELNGIAVIDECKAKKIIKTQYPDLITFSTVGLFKHFELNKLLSRDQSRNHVLKALKIGRMNVHVEDFRWILELIGESEAQNCPSLTKLMRKRGTNSLHLSNN